MVKCCAVRGSRLVGHLTPVLDTPWTLEIQSVQRQNFDFIIIFSFSGHLDRRK